MGLDGYLAAMNESPKLVAAAIVVEDGRVLVTRRAAGQSLAGLWEFPGGKIESEETPQHCIVRELAEELNITVVAGDVLCENVFQYPGGAINLIAVETEIESGSIALTVHDDFKWLMPSDLLSVSLAPADIPIARTIMRREAASV